MGPRSGLGSAGFVRGAAFVAAPVCCYDAQCAFKILFPCFNFDGGQVELGVFGACSRCTKSEVSQRGITACPSNYLELIVFLWFLAPSVGAVHVRASQSEDLANQVRHWVTYTSLVRKAGKQPGTFVSPAAAEWFSGLRCMFHDGKTTERYWILPARSSCQLDEAFTGWGFPPTSKPNVSRGAASVACQAHHFPLIFFRQANGSDKLKCISMFSGVAGLELGLRQSARQDFFRDLHVVRQLIVLL